MSPPYMVVAYRLIPRDIVVVTGHKSSFVHALSHGAWRVNTLLFGNGKGFNWLVLTGVTSFKKNTLGGGMV